jgi:hypothetical protein
VTPGREHRRQIDQAPLFLRKKSISVDRQNRKDINREQRSPPCVPFNPGEEDRNYPCGAFNPRLSNTSRAVCRPCVFITRDGDRAPAARAAAPAASARRQSAPAAAAALLQAPGRGRFHASDRCVRVRWAFPSCAARVSSPFSRARPRPLCSLAPTISGSPSLGGRGGVSVGHWLGDRATGLDGNVPPCRSQAAFFL